jgi:hypothetical protein
MNKVFQVLSMAVIVLTAASCGGGSSAGDINLFPVEINDRYGYINRKGETVINPQFDRAYLFRNGVALVKTDGQYGYINEKGEYLSTKRYKEALNFSEGLAWVVEENGAPTAIDTKGNEKFVLKQAGMVYPYSEGLAAFSTVDGKCGFVDKSGKVKIEPIFLYVSFFSDGLCAAKDTAAPYKDGFINTKGEFAIAPQFDFFADGFKNGLAAINIGNKYGVIDKAGKYVINPQFEYISPDGNLFAIKQDKKWGWCDKTGKYVINPQFDAVSPFCGGNFAPVKSGGKWGYVDKKGKIEINPQFDAAYPFIGNLAPVMTGKQWGFIDKEGKYVINPQFKTIAANDNIYNYLSGYKGGSVTSDYFNTEEIAATFDFAAPEGLTAASTYNDVMRIFGLSAKSFKKKYEEYKALSGKKIGTKVKYDFTINGTPYANSVFDGNRTPTSLSYRIFADTEAHAESVCKLLSEKYKDNIAVRLFVSDKTLYANISLISDDFTAFFKKFVEDKDFQSAHVKLSSTSDVTKDNWYGWEENTSRLDEASIYKESNDEYVWAALGNDSDINVTFKKIDGQWYLTDIKYTYLP